MKRSPWVPLDANFQDDPQIIDLSAPAELVFIRSLGHVKKHGRIVTAHLRRLCDKLDGVDRDTVTTELIDAGLWITDGDGWRISAWDSWNGPAESARKSASDNGKLANHVRWKHDGDLVDCALCYPENPLVNPSDSDPDPFRSPPGVRRGSDPLSDPPPDPHPRRDETTDGDEKAVGLPETPSRPEETHTPELSTDETEILALANLHAQHTGTDPTTIDRQNWQRDWINPTTWLLTRTHSNDPTQHAALLDWIFNRDPKAFWVQHATTPKHLWDKRNSIIPAWTGAKLQTQILADRPATNGTNGPHPKPPETMSPPVESDQDALDAEYAARRESFHS